MTPAEFIARKTPVPSEMLTRDWDRVQAEVRERSFFMASVTQHEILDAYHAGAMALTKGEVNPARAAEIVRERLIAMGYAPAPGTEGSIKDLTSWRRLRVTLETNRAMAQGYAGHLRALKAVDVFPAKQMMRLVRKKEPRNWAQRWQAMASGVPAEGANVEAMAAHIMHPIWRRVSRFGQPYPIYDFGSGMGDKVLTMAEARELGVATLPPPAPTEPAEPSMNDALEATPDIRSDEVKASLAEQLAGAAKWDGDRLVYLDPNGTRPDSPEQLAKVIRAKPEQTSPTWQADAVDAYVESGPDAFSPGSDALYDMARLVRRTEPMAAAPVLWHGRGFRSELERDMWVESLMAGEPSAVESGWPFWATDPAASQALDAAGDGPAVMVTIRGAEGARDLRPSMGPAAGRPGVFLESGFRLRVVKTETLGKIVNIVAEWIGGGTP